MSMRSLASVLVLSLALVPAAVRAEMPAQMAGKPEDVGLSSTQLKRLEAATKKNIDDGLMPGAVMLVARRGKVAWVSVQGKRTPDADDPMKFDSIFRIYSMTKPITSLVLMQLVEEGRLQVYDPVDKYLPEIGKMKVGTEVTVDGRPTLRLGDPERAMTVQDLLRHTAGLTYASRGTSLVHKAYIDAKVGDRTATNEEMVKRLGGVPLLFAPGEPLDTATHYVVFPDAIGHGRSSKPSDGLRMRFPKYDYDDMVDAQRRLLVEGLGVGRLRLIVGTSMGCMHAWVWGERYPGFADALVPLACAPTAIVGRNRIVRRLIVDAITSDPDWKGGDYAAPPLRGMRAATASLFMMVTAPHVLHRQAPTRAAADSTILAYLDRGSRAIDANDMIYAFEASRDYDPSPRLESIGVPVLAINFADDFVNPPELGLMERLMPRVRRGRYVLVPTSEQTVGHGTHSRPAVWREHLVEFLRTTEGAGRSP